MLGVTRWFIARGHRALFTKVLELERHHTPKRKQAGDWIFVILCIAGSFQKQTHAKTIRKGILRCGSHEKASKRMFLVEKHPLGRLARLPKSRFVRAPRSRAPLRLKRSQGSPPSGRMARKAPPSKAVPQDRGQASAEAHKASKPWEEGERTCQDGHLPVSHGHWVGGKRWRPSL